MNSLATITAVLAISATLAQKSAESAEQMFSEEPAQITAARNMRVGEIIQRSDLVTIGAEKMLNQQLAMLLGHEVKRTIYAGKPITHIDVGPRTMIARNAVITLEFNKGTLSITTQGRALDTGGLGDSIRVMNSDSKITVTAVVTGKNRAKTQ